jgi:hypothetical protein
MALGRVTRKITVYGGDDPPLGNHVILRVPNPIRTAAQKRQCAVTGLQFGRVIRRAKNPLQVKVYREAGYWVHELEELNIWSAEKEFEKSREHFRDFLLHLFQEYSEMTPGNATRAALAMRRRFEAAFPLEELVA